MRHLSLLLILSTQTFGSLQKILKSCSQCSDGSKDCCSFDYQLDVDPADYTANICPVMISEDSVEVRAGDDYTIRCELDSLCINGCEWITPQGRKCQFDKDSRYGDYCGPDANVQFVGDFAKARCDIRIEDLSERHEGTWRCVNKIQRRLSDTLNMTMTSKLPLKAALGISIPLGILGIFIFIAILIWCMCPSWITTVCSCCRKKDSHSEKVRQEAPPRSFSRRVHPEQSQVTYQEHHYEVSHDDDGHESTSSSAGAQSSAFQGFASNTSAPLPRRQRVHQPVVPPPVTYTRVETQVGSDLPRTARKISNSTSLSNYNTAFK